MKPMDMIVKILSENRKITGIRGIYPLYPYIYRCDYFDYNIKSCV